MSILSQGQSEAAEDGEVVCQLPFPLTYSHNRPWERRATLVRHALDALGRKSWYEALTLVDPCCRGSVPAPEDLLLRSEVLNRLGEAELSAKDLRSAYDINPSIASIQLRMLHRMWRQDEEASELERLAKRLLHPDTSIDVLRFCLLRVLNVATWSGAAFSTADRRTLRIFVLTQAPQAITVTIALETRSAKASVTTGPLHPYAGILGHAATIEFAWPEGAHVARFSVAETPLLWSSRVQARPRFEPRKPIEHPAARPGPQTSSVSGDIVTVIVPIYDGLNPTRRCLESLFADTMTLTPHRIVLVDDRGPDPRMAALLDAAVRRAGATGRSVVVLRNLANLGFIGSVNAALAAYPTGPVVLLNADTVVPPGWLDRLARAASGDRIATVTPLSNNGELVTMPRMFDGIALASMDDVERIDKIADAVASGVVVDMPNGIGFCLYITERGRAACGYLNDLDYDEGYLEEVDYCLRAAEQGLRNVCAADIFVGHEGGRSFKDRKRLLVVRNLGKLERRFPNVRGDTHRFMVEDPLGDVRHALQLELLRAKAFTGGQVLVVIGGLPASERRGEAAFAGWRSLVPVIQVSSSIQPDGWTQVHLDSQGVVAPANLDVAFEPGTDAAGEIVRLLAPFDVVGVVFADLLPETQPLIVLPGLLGVRFDLRLTHDGFAADPLRRSLLAGARRVTTASPRLLTEARSLGRADAFLDDIANNRSARSEGRALLSDVARPPSCAVIYQAGDAALRTTLLAMLRGSLAAGVPLRMVFFGDAPEEELLATGAALYGGDPDAAETAAWFRVHGCRVTIFASRTPFYEHRLQRFLDDAPRPILTFSRTAVDFLGEEGTDWQLLSAHSATDELRQLAESFLAV